MTKKISEREINKSVQDRVKEKDIPMKRREGSPYN